MTQLNQEQQQYKPILVFYLEEGSDHREEMIKRELIRIEQGTGYICLIVWVESSKRRVELLSVDKSTVVSDIKEYLDAKIISEQ